MFFTSPILCNDHVLYVSFAVLIHTLVLHSYSMYVPGATGVLSTLLLVSSFLCNRSAAAAAAAAGLEPGSCSVSGAGRLSDATFLCPGLGAL